MPASETERDCFLSHLASQGGHGSSLNHRQNAPCGCFRAVDSRVSRNVFPPGQSALLLEIRQQMGHASESMTVLYTGEIPVDQVQKQFQLEPNGAAVAA